MHEFDLIVIVYDDDTVQKLDGVLGTDGKEMSVSVTVTEDSLVAY